MEEFIKQMEQFITPPPKIDEHGKQSSLEEDSIKIIGTRPPISFHVLHIVQHIVITNTNGFSEKYQIIIGKIVDKTIPRIINHNLRYRTTV